MTKYPFKMVFVKCLTIDGGAILSIEEPEGSSTVARYLKTELSYFPDYSWPRCGADRPSVPGIYEAEGYAKMSELEDDDGELLIYVEKVVRAGAYSLDLDF